MKLLLIYFACLPLSYLLSYGFLNHDLLQFRKKQARKHPDLYDEEGCRKRFKEDAKDVALFAIPSALCLGLLAVIIATTSGRGAGFKLSRNTYEDLSR